MERHNWARLHRVLTTCCAFHRDSASATHVTADGPTSTVPVGEAVADVICHATVVVLVDLDRLDTD